MKLFDFINYEELKREFFSKYRYKSLSECLTYYLDVLKECECIPEFGHIYQNLEVFVSQLLEAERLFKLGMIGRCYNCVYKLLFAKDGILSPDLATDSFNCYPCPAPTFYRMRAMDNSYLLKDIEMLHIPFDKRDIVENQRFSLSGFPCLYLGSSSYLCWEELNRPNHLMANASAFTVKKDFRFLNLTFPKKIEKEADIYRLMLVFACSLKNNTVNKRTFKEEYIIPQALLHSLMEHNYTNRHNAIDGILYVSTHYKSDYVIFDDIKLFYNLVIPTQQYKNESVCIDEGYCEGICSLFHYTKPTSINQLQINQPAFVKRNRDDDDCNYYPSDFWLLECYLSSSV